MATLRFEKEAVKFQGSTNTQPEQLKPIYKLYIADLVSSLVLLSKYAL